MVFDGEDTADYSEDSESESESVSMVTKVIATLVALLIVVVLAFPVANSLTASDDTEDNNGEPIEYTNTGDYHYKLTENDDSRWHMLINISNGIITVSIQSIESSSDNTVLYTHPLGDTQEPLIYLAGGSNSFIWLNADGTMSWQYDNHIGGGVYLSLVVINDGYFDTHSAGIYPIDYYLFYEGEYVYSDNKPIVANTDTLYIGQAIATDSDDVFAVCGKGTTANIRDKLQVSLNNPAYDTYSLSISATSNFDKHSDYTVLKSMTVKVNSEELNKHVTIPVTGFFVPVSVTYTPDVEEGLSGVAKVLVMLVPTLLVLGVLLIFVMPMLKRDEEII